MAFFPFNFIVENLILPVFPLTQNLSKQSQMCPNNISSQISHIHPNLAPKRTTDWLLFPTSKKT
jgi:hypothetical protein